MRRFALALLACLGLAAAASPVRAAGEDDASLRGSKASMHRQNRVAKESEFRFFRTAGAVLASVARGELVDVSRGADYVVAGVSFPFARPEIRTFLDRLAQQHRAACGEKLVVTSLTRPILLQPSNASPLSVHPAGMAVDLRVSSRASCRRWLERTLLALEARGVLDATREHYPPHYHVAVFPRPYLRYVEGLLAREAERLAAQRKAEREEAARAAMEQAVVTADVAMASFGAALPLPRRAMESPILLFLAAGSGLVSLLAWGWRARRGVRAE